MLALDGLLALLQVRFDLPPFSLPRIVLFALLLFLALTSLIRGRTGKGGSLWGMTWGVVVYLIGLAGSGYALMVFAMVSRASHGKPPVFTSEWEIYQMVQRIVPSDSSVLTAGLWIGAGVALALAGTGLIVFFSTRRRFLAAAGSQRP